MSAASSIRIIVSDVDGVWTDGNIVYVGEQREIKNFNVRDGMGAKLAQKAGLGIVLITSRRSPALVRRARGVGVEELHQGAANKLAGGERGAEKLAGGVGQMLYGGGDPPDPAPRLR